MTANPEGTPEGTPERPPLRVSTAERASAMKALDEHLAAGRLDPQEYADRSAAAAEARVAEDLAAMRELNAAKLPEFVELQAVVSSWSTVQVKHGMYSVPSRLIGETVRVRLFEARIELWFAGEKQLDCERLRGRHPRRIDYRHVI